MDFKQYHNARKATTVISEVKMTPSIFNNFLSSPDAAQILLGFEAELLFPPESFGIDEEKNVEAIVDRLNEEEFGGYDDDDTFGNAMQSVTRIIQDGGDWEHSSYGHNFDKWLAEARDDGYMDARREKEDEFIQENLTWKQWGLWSDDNNPIDYIEQFWDDPREVKQFLQILNKKYETSHVRDLDAFGALMAQASVGLSSIDDDYLDNVKSDLESELESYEDKARSELMDQFADDDDFTFADYMNDRFGSVGDFISYHDSIYEFVGAIIFNSNSDSEEFLEAVASALSDSDLGIDAEPNFPTSPESDTWGVSLDGSVSDQEGEGDRGVEIQSAPMPLPEAIEKIHAFFDWVKSLGGRANGTTGFHINMSIKNHRDRVDPLKLALLAGDRKVLQDFDRENNSYANDIVRELYKKLAGASRAEITPEKAKQIMNDVVTGKFNRESRSELTNRAFSLLDTKYSSVHNQGNYVEFRSPGGGNQSNDYTRQVDLLIQAALRFAYAISIAANPEAFKEDYMKKLGKLVTHALSGKMFPRESPVVLPFAKLMSGEIKMPEYKAITGVRQLNKGVQTHVMEKAKKLYDNVARYGQTPHYVPDNDEIKFALSIDKDKEVSDALKVYSDSVGDNWGVTAMNTNAYLRRMNLLASQRGISI